MSIDLFTQQVQLSTTTTPIAHQYPVVRFLQSSSSSATKYEDMSTSNHPGTNGSHHHHHHPPHHRTAKNILTNKVLMVLEGHSPIESPTSSINDDTETPPVDRWSRDFKSLIRDPDGVEVFKQFMNEADLGGMIDFWFACKGLKEQKIEEQIVKRRLINVIFKRFILRSNVIRLSEKCRQSLIDLYGRSRQDQSVLDENTFDEAAKEVEDQLSGSIYQNFLRSELFLNHFNFSKESNTHKDDDIKNDDSNYDVQSVMPTIDEVNEESEASQSECNDQSGSTTTTVAIVDNQQQLQHQQLVNKMSQLTTNSLASIESRVAIDGAKKPYLPSQSKKRSYNPMMIESYFKAISQDPPPNPYHVRYSTVVQNSKRDSEIQSISSHSTTSDSYSCVSGGSRGEKHHTSHGHHIRRSIPTNPVLFPMQPFTTRPQRPQTNTLDPTNNIDQFAKILIEKLNKVRLQQEADLKLEMAMKECNRDSPALSQREAGVGQHSAGGKQAPKSGFEKAWKDAWKKIDFSSIESESGQAILDKHFAQVFNETPNSCTPTATSALIATNPTYAMDSSSRYHYTVDNTANNSTTALPPPSPLSPTHSMFGGQHTIPVTVKFSNEDCPYKLTLAGPVTLLSFKQQIPSKKGNHQYYFKRKCTEKEKGEFNSSYVHEKIHNDDTILPQCEGKIFAIVELS